MNIFIHKMQPVISYSNNSSFDDQCDMPTYIGFNRICVVRI